jgi:hypothetical protein
MALLCGEGCPYALDACLGIDGIQSATGQAVC